MLQHYRKGFFFINLSKFHFYSQASNFVSFFHEQSLHAQKRIQGSSFKSKYVYPLTLSNESPAQNFSAKIVRRKYSNQHKLPLKRGPEMFENSCVLRREPLKHKIIAKYSYDFEIVLISSKNVIYVQNAISIFFNQIKTSSVGHKLPKKIHREIILK